MRTQSAIGMQMCVFAFVEPTEGNSRSRSARRHRELHYISDNLTTSHLTLPYLVPAPIVPWPLDRHAALKRDALQVIRTRETQVHGGQYPYFVRALQAAATMEYDRAALPMLATDETEQHLLYAPCGELSFFWHINPLGMLLQIVQSPV